MTSVRQYAEDEVMRAVVKQAVQKYYSGATVLGRVVLCEQIAGDPSIRVHIPDAILQSRVAFRQRIVRALKQYGCTRRNNHYRSNGVDLSPQIFAPLTTEERGLLQVKV